MSAMDIGRICVKLRGREKGNQCVIVDVVDRNYVVVTGPPEINGVRRRRVNMSHLQPLEETIDIRRNATDEEILDLLNKL
jgi:large subunit ribosomal protein L14e